MRFVDFDKALRKANIPIHGVSGNGPLIRIDFKDEATEQQRNQARTLAQSFDWNEKQPRQRSAIAQDIRTTPQAIENILAELLLLNPDLADKVGISIKE